MEIIATYYSLLGVCYQFATPRNPQNLSLALQAHQDALELREINQDKKNPDIFSAISYCNLAKVTQDLQIQEEAQNYFHASQQGYQAYSKKNPEALMYFTPLSETLYLLGEFYFSQNKNIDAIQIFLKGMSLEKQYYDGNKENYSCAVLFSRIKAALNEVKEVPYAVLNEILNWKELDNKTPVKDERWTKLDRILQAKVEALAQLPPLELLLRSTKNSVMLFTSDEKNQHQEANLSLIQVTPEIVTSKSGETRPRGYR